MITSFVLMPVFGINQAIQPIIGYNFGAKKYDRVKKTVKLGMIFGCGILVLGSIIIRVFPENLIALFNKDSELIDLGVHILKVGTLAIPILGIQFIGTTYFQSVGKYKQATMLTLSRQFLILLPSLLIFSHFLGLYGLFYAMPITDVVCTIITAIAVHTSMKRLEN